LTIGLSIIWRGIEQFDLVRFNKLSKLTRYK
jgi:hypothetical protein